MCVSYRSVEIGVKAISTASEIVDLVIFNREWNDIYAFIYYTIKYRKFSDIIVSPKLKDHFFKYLYASIMCVYK